MPATRSLPKRPTLDMIVRVVSRYYGIAAQDLCRPRRGRGTGARGMAMLLAYREGGLTQAAIAAPFGVTYFAVSRAIAAQQQRVAAAKIPAKALVALTAQLQT